MYIKVEKINKLHFDKKESLDSTFRKHIPKQSACYYRTSLACKLTARLSIMHLPRVQERPPFRNTLFEINTTFNPIYSSSGVPLAQAEFQKKKTSNLLKDNAHNVSLSTKETLRNTS